MTKALVNEFYNMESLPRDRPLSERRLLIYRRILDAGEFRPVTWASAHCAETDGIYRVNGKHTSTLLYEREPLPEFFVTVERYECPTLEDVARLYATFDSRTGMRNAGDILLSFASTVKEFANLKKKTFSLASGAASYHAWGPTFYIIPVVERAEKILDNIDFTIWLDGILWPSVGDQKNASHLWRNPVAAAMIGTFNRHQKDADHFWQLVRDESAPSTKDASRTLAKYLIRKGVRTQMLAGGRGREGVTFREMYVKCLHAWNAWRKGLPTDLKFYPSSKDPAIQ